MFQNYDNLAISDGKKHHRRHQSSGSIRMSFDGPMKRVFDSIELVPTKEADASRYKGLDKLQLLFIKTGWSYNAIQPTERWLKGTRN